MPASRVGRRRFLKTAGRAALAAGAVAALPAPLLAQRGPARVRLGFVGLGQRGVQLARAARSLPGVEIVAAADLYDGRLARAAEIAGGSVAAARDHRRVIENKDVDAVVIATPDHWHARLALAAAAAGKDVYCESPLTHSPAEAEAIAQAFGAGGRLLQTGASLLGSPLLVAAREQLQGGRLGKVTLAQGVWETASATEAWLVPFPPDASPETIDFESFLGGAPERAFDLHRFFRWQRYWDYGSGLAGARFADQLAALQWLLDAAAPERATAAGGLRRWRDGREVPDVLAGNFDYSAGFGVSLLATQNGGHRRELRLVGSEATLVIAGDRLSLFPEPLAEPFGDVGESWPREYRDWFYMMHGLTPEGQPRGGPALAKAAEVYELPTGGNEVAAHLADFVDAVRSRRAPRASAALGLAAAAGVHMANESYRQGRSVTR